MDLQLERGDLLQLDPISNKGTLRLFPIGKKNKQKLVVGDDSGSLGCYEFSKGDARKVFTARPFENPITSVVLGGANAATKDEILAACNQTIVRYTKKGKELKKLEANVTEPIHHLAYTNPRIWMGCECIYSLFENNVQSDVFYMSPHEILSFAVDHILRDYDAVLGCRDDCIRILQGSSVALEIPTSGPVTALVTMPCVEDARGRRGNAKILYGTENGDLHLCSINAPSSPPASSSPSSASAAPLASAAECVTHHWTLPDPRRSPITSLCLADVTKDGTLEIIVSRNDGRVEVYGGQERTLAQGLPVAAPSKRFSRDIGESIKTVDCGLLNSTVYNEVVLASYSGKIISFTTEPVRARAEGDSYGRSVQVLLDEKRILNLQSELKETRKQIEALKKGKADGGGARKGSLISTLTGGVVGGSSSSFSSSSSSSSGAPSSSSSPSVPTDFPYTATFALDHEHSTYTLSIEVQTPLDMVVLRSPIVLDLTDNKPGQGDNSSAIISVTPARLLSPLSTEDNPCRFLAAIRASTASERRLSISLRPLEGESGDLILTIVTGTSPKMAKMVRFPLKPLSLHYRVHALTQEEEERPKNRVKFSGNVSLLVLHEWVSQLFPDIPPRLLEGVEEETLLFRNCFTQAITVCRLRRNELEVESQSASTIAIVRKGILDQAVYRRMQVSDALFPQKESIRSLLQLLRPRLEYQLSLSRRFELCDCIADMAMQDASGQTTAGTALDAKSIPIPAWFTPEYAQILRDQQEIRQDYKARETSLEYLAGIIQDLYVDWHSLRGVDVKRSLGQASQLILAGDFEQLVAFIAGTEESKGGLGGLPSLVGMPRGK